MIGLLRNAGDRRQRQLRRAEQQIAVAALKRGFLAYAEARAVQRLARRGRLWPARRRQGQLAQEGVPQELIFLAQAESAFQPRAISSAYSRLRTG
jgi:soluble lytic murein transglycosylase-like protein